MLNLQCLFAYFSVFNLLSTVVLNTSTLLHKVIYLYFNIKEEIRVPGRIQTHNLPNWVCQIKVRGIWILHDTQIVVLSYNNLRHWTLTAVYNLPQNSGIFGQNVNGNKKCFAATNRKNVLNNGFSWRVVQNFPTKISKRKMNLSIATLHQFQLASWNYADQVTFKAF